MRQATRYLTIPSERSGDGFTNQSNPLPAVRVGGKMLLNRSDLDAWLLRHRVKPFNPQTRSTASPNTLLISSTDANP